mgnify:CR=1 FL=1
MSADQQVCAWRMQNIAGAYFKPHVMERAEERLGISDFDHDKWEERIVDLEGDLYYDRKYERFQICFDELAFAFHTQIHNDRPGLLAYVHTTLSNPNEFRDSDDRFQKISITDQGGES